MAYDGRVMRQALQRFEEDRRELRRLIEAHVRHTNSALGRRMLDAWEQYAPQFIKITPVEYKRYLEQQPR